MGRYAFLLAVVGLALAFPGSAAADSGLKFKPCAKRGFECGTLKVPLDYDKPGGPKIKLAVTRRPANDRARRIGPLFINYGGPGADAAASTQAFGTKLFAAYLDRFDLVAVDPRGTGDSRPALDCKANQERVGVYHQPFTRVAGRGDRRELARARFYAHRCERRSRKLAAHVSTANVARDTDRVRRALGERKLSYFGFSYGTLLGATYSALYPSHVRVAVLDGAVDPDSYLTDPSLNLRQQTAALELALDRYLAACKGERRYCRWVRRGTPRAAYDRLVRRADRKPIPAPDREITQGRTRPVSGHELNFGIVGDLYAKQLWPEITKALNRASRGDASILRLLVDSSYGRRKQGGFEPFLDRYFMIGAAEQRFSTDPQTVFDAEAANLAAFPHFFFNGGQAELPYTVYGSRDADSFADPFELPKSGPTPLVIGTTFDPATPYADARRLTDTLGTARLLTMRGDGHTAYGGNSPCIDEAVDRYVIRGKLPGRNTRCRQRVPFPPPPEPAAASSAAAAALDPVPRAAPQAPLTAPFAR